MKNKLKIVFSHTFETDFIGFCFSNKLNRPFLLDRRRGSFTWMEEKNGDRIEEPFEETIIELITLFLLSSTTLRRLCNWNKHETAQVDVSLEEKREFLKMKIENNT